MAFLLQGHISEEVTEMFKDAYTTLPHLVFDNPDEIVSQG